MDNILSLSTLASSSAIKNQELYHFTCIRHLGEILADAQLSVTDSCLHLFQSADEFPVLWLTNNPNADRRTHMWAVNGYSEGRMAEIWDKLRIRFTVLLPVVEYDPVNEDSKCVCAYSWDDWSRAHDSEEFWRKILIKTGGDAQSWFVSPKPVTRYAWKRIEDAATGQLIYDRKVGLTRKGIAFLESYFK